MAEDSNTYTYLMPKIYNENGRVNYKVLSKRYENQTDPNSDSVSSDESIKQTGTAFRGRNAKRSKKSKGE